MAHKKPKSNSDKTRRRYRHDNGYDRDQLSYGFHTDLQWFICRTKETHGPSRAVAQRQTIMGRVLLPPGEGLGLEISRSAAKNRAASNSVYAFPSDQSTIFALGGLTNRHLPSVMSRLTS